MGFDDQPRALAFAVTTDTTIPFTKGTKDVRIHPRILRGRFKRS